jgi:hypothetical protein
MRFVPIKTQDQLDLQALHRGGSADAFCWSSDSGGSWPIVGERTTRTPIPLVDSARIEMALAPHAWRFLFPRAAWKCRSPEASRNFLTFLESSRWLMSKVEFNSSGSPRKAATSMSARSIGRRHRVANNRSTKRASQAEVWLNGIENTAYRQK